MSTSSKQNGSPEAKSLKAEQNKNLRDSTRSTSSSRKSLPHFSKVMYSLPVPDYTPKKGESIPRRHPAVVNDKELISQYDPNVKTLWDLFQATVSRLPSKDFLGTRTRLESGQAGPFEWKTYSEVNEDILNLGQVFNIIKAFNVNIFNLLSFVKDPLLNRNNNFT